ncbi:CBS domain-containing protein [Actinospica sp. MGRD01-02]|uniref:CBS domain-containing protein n=1 Tax=Actinospica acidithermotolerans TaxID=2828514 RepID=A0A941IHY2_9ACTN|nr:CBS domain-containing protein [Actinospica acidithermotolerans]MBR7825628.1 CBS domain-containing protein [Actinospica acidithermotolerans]
MTATKTPGIGDATALPAGPTARDVMSPVDGVIGEDATLREVVRGFLDGQGRHLIVVDRDGRCTGVLGPRHIAQAHRFDLLRDEEIPISELCGEPWVALSPPDSLETCAQMLVEYDLDAIPVLDEDRRVLGVVTAHDVVRAGVGRPTSRRPRRRG